MQTVSAIVILLCGIKAIPIDNRINGNPEIDCGPTSITVSFNVQNNFEGNLYVKGLFEQPECKVSGSSLKTPSITLPFDGCNTLRSRSLNPKGIFVSTIVVISFHPQFVTKVDSAYRVQCFYMEAEKTVSTNLEVSDMSTLFGTLGVPMPICKYEILDGGPGGEQLHFATIGQQVYHKWTCESETVDTFCAVVHSCHVDDGNGNRIEILNSDGCALDKYLLNNLEYPSDLMAGQETHVYKYADKSQIFYQCQISITIKEPNEDCPRPICTEPQGFGAVKAVNPDAVIVVEPSAVGVAETESPAPSPDIGPVAPPESEPFPPKPEPPSSGSDLPATDAEVVESGYRWRRSADENIIDVATDLETLDIMQPGLILPENIRRQNLQYLVEIRNGVCITPLQVSLLFAAIIFLAVAAFVTVYAFKH